MKNEFYQICILFFIFDISIGNSIHLLANGEDYPSRPVIPLG